MTTLSKDAGKSLRQLAEERVDKEIHLSQEQLSPEQMNQKLHDLLVHQAELEMQNEELLRTQLELAASQARYFDLYEFAPVGYLSISNKKLILRANISAAAMLGLEKKDLIKRQVSDFIYLEDQDIFYLNTKRVLEKNDLNDWEMRFMSSGGLPIWVHIQAVKEDNANALLLTFSDISNRKQTEIALRLSEERYRNIVESQTEFIDRYTHGGILTYVNPALARFVGVEAEALLGHSFYSFIHEDDRDECVRLIELISVQNPTVEVSGHIVLPDGTSRWVRWSQTGIFDETGSLIEYQAVGKDITEQRLAEIRLQESEKKYRLIFETAGDGISVMDPQGKLLTVNPLACNMLGYSYDELISLSADKIDARPDEMAANALTLMETGYYSGETVFIRKDGTTVPISVDARIIVWEGQPAILSICRDITSRKQIEENLRNSEQTLKSIIDANPEPHFLVERNGTIIMANSSLAKRLGRHVSEVEGYNIAELDPPDLHERRKFMVEEVFMSGKPNFFAELRDGRELENYINPVIHQNGKVAQVTILSIDVTEKNLINRQLVNSQKLENFGIIASGFAHNFNNALTSVLGYIELSLMRVEKSHKAYDLLSCANDSANRAAEMVSQLMFYSKECKTIGNQPLSLVKLAEESAFLSTAGSNVTSRLMLPPSLHSVIGDENLIRIAFQCLCSNAVQAMPKGGTLTISGRNVDASEENMPVPAEGEYVEISFGDQGCGIAAKDRSKIFTPYFTSKAEFGAGLGLATVHSVITRHGGAVTFVSETGKGTSFTLYLPAAADPEEL